MDQDYNCALCLEFQSEHPDEDYFVSTECGHIYHYLCVKQSYDTGYKECPVDRLPIDMTKLRRLYGTTELIKGQVTNPATRGPLAPPYDYKFKIILVGDPSVGKSCLMQRYTDDLFSTNVFATVGCDWRTKTIEVGGKIVNLSIWDTVGQEKYRSIVTNYVRDAVGALIVYDITSAGSTEFIQGWVDFVKDHGIPDIAMILIGNKKDLQETHREVTKETGKKLAAKLGNLPFIETSAKDTYNVDVAFRTLAAKILDSPSLLGAVEAKMRNPNISLGGPRTKNSVDENLLRNICSQSWIWTKSGVGGMVQGIKDGWDYLGTKNSRENGSGSTNHSNRPQN